MRIIHANAAERREEEQEEKKKAEWRGDGEAKKREKKERRRGHRQLVREGGIGEENKKEKRSQAATKVSEMTERKRGRRQKKARDGERVRALLENHHYHCQPSLQLLLLLCHLPLLPLSHHMHVLRLPLCLLLSLSCLKHQSSCPLSLSLSAFFFTWSHFSLSLSFSLFTPTLSHVCMSDRTSQLLIHIMHIHFSPILQTQ